MSKLDGLIAWYENLSPETVVEAGRFYASDASFKDPFNEVRGIGAIEHIFRHMFVQVEEPRFVVTGRFSGEDGAMLLWEFHFRTRGLGAQALCVKGASHLRFDAAGRVAEHRDYWDAAGELYARLPLIGAPMRLLLRMGAAK
ncbi:MAG: nuclear transport factor 2 family protein [Sulfuritalea sp.]|nr:nuclear transport factor 2 family protein [Sulfuritalea sp.]